MNRKHRRTTSIDGIIHTYRKVLWHGESLSVTLPIKWVREHNIKPGDELVMTASSMVTLAKNPEKLKVG